MLLSGVAVEVLQAWPRTPPARALPAATAPPPRIRRREIPEWFSAEGVLAEVDDVTLWSLSGWKSGSSLVEQ